MEDLTEIYNRIYRYCFYKIRNSAVSEDITQEAFLKYFSQNRSLRREEDLAYLYTIAKNLCMDWFRKKPAKELSDDCSTEGFADNSETKIAVRTAMEKLDERSNEVILLRYIAGLSVHETANAMGISRFAVHRLERAALAEMKKYLKGAL